MVARQIPEPSSEVPEGYLFKSGRVQFPNSFEIFFFEVIFDQRDLGAIQTVPRKALLYILTSNWVFCPRSITRVHLSNERGDEQRTPSLC
jgi:hypothetical protein